MRESELYGRYDQLIDSLARSAEPESDWRTGPKAFIGNFEADASALDTNSAWLLREELCVQLEHEALHSTRPLARHILFAAITWLELGD